MDKCLISMVLIVSGLLNPGAASAAAPACHIHNSVPYCSYTGKVKRAYVNATDTILLYFDTSLDLNLPASVGIAGVTSASAAAIKRADNPEFAKTAYATLLTAQSRDATITVQMRGTHGGYLKIDRIWIYE